MADEAAVRRLRAGVTDWKAGRKLTRVVDLTEADLAGANLAGADLSFADLTGADLTGANLRGANLLDARLYAADLTGADLTEADLLGADLTKANLTSANLTRANLATARLINADVTAATLNAAKLLHTVFTDVDLSQTRGLGDVRHLGPSYVAIDTLYRSAGRIPEAFLRGCGVPDAMIQYVPSLVGAVQALSFYSCFISYSTKDEAFAERLHERLRAQHVRVWFAPEDVKGGEKLHEQIDQAIELHDRLLLVLSGHSLASRWVVTEVRRALAQERKQRRRKLFPILLGPYALLEAWDAFDSGSGTYLRDEIGEYYIPDFSNWKDHDAFEAAFAKLLRDLRAADGQRP
jgi:hypothetical protein